MLVAFDTEAGRFFQKSRKKVYFFSKAYCNFKKMWYNIVRCDANFYVKRNFAWQKYGEISKWS